MFCLFHLCEQTNRQTDKQTDKPTYPKFIWCSENKPLRPAMPGLAAIKFQIFDADYLGGKGKK